MLSVNLYAFTMSVTSLAFYTGGVQDDMAERDVTDTRPHLKKKAEKVNVEPSVTGKLGHMDTEHEMRGISGGEVTVAIERSEVHRDWGKSSGYMGILVGTGGVVGRERLYLAATTDRRYGLSP